VLLCGDAVAAGATALHSATRLGADFAGVSGLQQRDDLPQGGQADQGVDHAGQHGVLAAEDRRDQVELGETDQAPVDAADDHEHEGDEVDGFHGMSTLSMTWMTPLLASMSALVT